MSVANSATNLLQAVKDLRIEWEQAREHWRDSKCEEFNRTYLENLPADAARAAVAMKELDAILKQIREDCE